MQDTSQRTQTIIRRHPLGVRPSGNALTSTVNIKDASGSFARLPDELLMHVLEAFDAAVLLRVGATCRALFAFTRTDELWRALFIESQPPNFEWRGTWRSTFLAQPQSNEARVDCSNLFSDLLHRPFYCAHVPLSRHAENIPSRNQIARFPDLTPAAFAADWVNRPFILTSPVKQWPIFQTCSTDPLLSHHAATLFRAEAVDWPLQTYIEYMRNNHDESPLYLFDRAFASKMALPPGAYSAPPCFGPDLFTLLGASRPDHRWLILGPARSGSTFHQDPNATSAWNAVLAGRKYWIMFPPAPGLLPPGVFVSADRAEVTAPLSVAEWLLGFHGAARRTAGCVEAVCARGELLHVPSGWYHLVLNLETSVAITQNFVPQRRLGAVLAFLRDQAGNCSGFAEGVSDPYGLFVERLREAAPALLEEGLREVERGDRGRWGKITKCAGEGDGGDGGFAFAFAAGDEDGEVP